MAPSMSEARARWRRRGAAAALFLLVLLIYRESVVSMGSDTDYTALASFALLDGHGLDVASYLPRPLDPRRHPGMKQPHDPDGLPYQLMDVDGRLVPYYLPGTAVLSAPLFALMRPLGYGPFDAQGRYEEFSERRAMRHVAFLLAASFAVLVFLMASELLPLSMSFALGLAAALATPAWSTLSRGLWSHDWLVVLTAAAVWLLLRSEIRGRPAPALLLGTFAAWSCFVRPTGVLVLAGVGVLTLLRSRRAALRYAVAALFWALIFGFSLQATYGTVLPRYVTGHALATGGWALAEALAGTLVSPSRGLLVFCPWIVWIAWLLGRYRHTLRPQGWVALAAAIVGAQWLVVAASPKWWGGHSYGPRLMSDVLPWLLLVAVLALDARRRAVGTAGGRLENAIGVAAVLVAALLHAPGALSWRVYEWNGLRADVNQEVGRLWSWSDAQFLAWRERRD